MENWTEWQGLLYVCIIPWTIMFGLAYINGALMQSKKARRMVRKIKKGIAWFFLHYFYHYV